MNYVAQPGDNVRLIPKIGPYDLFATEWGYKPLPQAQTTDDEKKYLDEIASRQVTNPMLRFGNASGEDPTRRMEDLGADPIEASTLGLRNIKRILGYLVPAVSRFGEDYKDLDEMYNMVLFQRTLEVGHVASLVGGVVQTNYNYGRGTTVYNPVPPAKQREAVRFLVTNMLQTPKELIAPSILSRIEPSGAADRILQSQQGVLSSLMSEGRTRRMVDQEAAAPAGAKPYTVAEMMEDVRKGVWGELAQPSVVVDPYRRNLQRAYIGLLAGKLAPASTTTLPGLPFSISTGGATSDVRPLARLSLITTRASIQNALKRATDPVTKAHLMDATALIDQALDPRGASRSAQL
jgi:hypothetical protein